MTELKPVTGYVDKDMKRRVAQEIKRHDRSESWLVNEALKRYFEPQPRKPQVSTD